MTIQELIDFLMAQEDKSRYVAIYDGHELQTLDDEFTWYSEEPEIDFETKEELWPAGTLIFSID